MPRTRSELALRGVAIAGVVAGLAWVLHALDVGAVRDALARATLWPLVIAVIANFGILAAKATAWRLLLAPDHRVGTWRLFRYTVIAYAASAALPLRAGELLRIWLLRERDGVPAAYATAVAIAEKLLDVLSMLALTATLPLLGRHVPREIALWLGGLSAAVLVAILVLRVLAPRVGGQLGRGLAVLRDRRRWLAAAGVLLVGWVIDLAMIDLLLVATGIDLPLGAGVLLVFAINVAVAVPSTPGQIGALELGALLGLKLLGVREEPALAFAILYHVLQLGPTLALGLVFGARSEWRTAPRSLAPSAGRELP